MTSNGFNMAAQAAAHDHAMKAAERTAKRAEARVAREGRPALMHCGCSLRT